MTVNITIPEPTAHDLKGNTKRGQLLESGTWRYEEFVIDDQTSCEATIEYDIDIEKAGYPDDANAINVTISRVRVTAYTVWSDCGIDLTGDLTEIERQELHDMLLECFAEQKPMIVAAEEGVNR
jgi:hypothetical protein